MGVTTIPAPAQMQTGSVLDFLLQMSSLEERKKYRKVQERHVDVVEGQLGIAKKEWEAGKPARKEAKVTAEYRTEAKEKLFLANRQREVLRRQLHKSIAYGDNDTADATRFLLKKVDNIIKDSPLAAEAMFFADEMGKDLRAQLALAQQQAFTANQTIDMMDKQFKYNMQRLGSQYNAVASAITPKNLPAGIAAMNAIQTGDDEMLGKMLSSMRATTAAGKREPEERKFTPSKLNAEVVAEFGSGTYQQMLVAEAANLPYPDVRSVYSTGGVFGFDWRKILTREEAKAKGAEDEWLKATPIDLERMGDRIQPKQEAKPDKKKTVKELAGEGAKKAKPAGSKKGEAKKTIRVISPDGVPGWIFEEQLEDALKQGYKQID